MARKRRSTAGTGKKKKKKTARKSAPASGTKKPATKRAGRRSKTGRKTAVRRKTGTRRRHNTRPKTIGGKIASALQAVVDAVADSELLHGRPHPRSGRDSN